MPLVLLALLALLPFWRELFSTSLVLSEKSTDIALHFLYSRMFGFGEMAHGNLPLWNPQIYGGIPYLGQFQSALLYPPNLIFLILPAATAINWSIALHVFLLGAATYGWASYRNLLPSAAFVAGCSAMFGGAFFLHIYAGHLSNICSMPWAALIFWGIDGWLRSRHAGWIFLAAGAAALQIYAGHPQYFYYGALVAGLYALVLLPGANRPVVAAGGLIAIYPLACLFAAAQLLPGMSAASESVRSGGVSYEFASMFSFPPENFLTLVTPWIFGNMRDVPYWGRCYLWEMSLFAGVGMLLLAVLAFATPWEKRGRTRMLVTLGVVFLLALGMHTPLHQFLYQFLPGFSGFRGSSKFIFFASVLLSLCAGMGVNALWQGRKCPPALIFSALGLGLVLTIGAFLVSPDTIRQVLTGIFATKESYLNPAALSHQELLRTFQTMSFHSLLIGGGSVIFFAALLWLTRRWRAVIWVAIVCAVAEVFFFARGTVVSSPVAELLYRPVQDLLKQNPGDYRVLNLFNGDASMIFPNGNIWGYDPSVLKRYAQLLSLSQGADPAKASQYLPFQRPHPILALVRGKIAMIPKGSGEINVTQIAEPFPHFAAFSQYKVIPNPEERFATLGSPDFNFSETVVLEKEPIPKPDVIPAKFEIRELESSTDSLSLEVVVDRASLLLITDSYSKDWMVESLPGSTQITYEFLPANHALRAVPLAAGRHVFRLFYSPAGLGLGTLVTILSLISATLLISLRQTRDFLNFSKEGMAVNAHRSSQI